MEIPQRVLDRVPQYTDVRGPDECWPWTLSIGSHGYGQIGWNEGAKHRKTTAHRVAFTAVHGPIPDGLTVDHICHNRRCVNPAHLRLLTRPENASLNSFKLRTHCFEGHPYDEANTVLSQTGARVCLTCRRERYRRKKAAKS